MIPINSTLSQWWNNHHSGRGELGDYRGIPTCACPACGSHLLEITALFSPDTYEIEMYLLDNARCAMCQAELTAPTPIDHPAA